MRARTRLTVDGDESAGRGAEQRNGSSRYQDITPFFETSRLISSLADGSVTVANVGHHWRVQSHEPRGFVEQCPRASMDVEGSLKIGFSRHPVRALTIDPCPEGGCVGRHPVSRSDRFGAAGLVPAEDVHRPEGEGMVMVFGLSFSAGSEIGKTGPVESLQVSFTGAPLMPDLMLTSSWRSALGTGSL